jgi:hypothetical protein
MPAILYPSSPIQPMLYYRLTSLDPTSLSASSTHKDGRAPLGIRGQRLSKVAGVVERLPARVHGGPWVYRVCVCVCVCVCVRVTVCHKSVENEDADALIKADRSAARARRRAGRA